MRRIPKSLCLLGHTITVRVCSKREWEQLCEMSEHIDEDDFGVWFQSKNLIVIRRTKRSLMWHTFVHELLHAVLDMMNSPLSYDEAFVDNLSGLLSQALDSAR
jgi:hypothetical protein